MHWKIAFAPTKTSADVSRSTLMSIVRRRYGVAHFYRGDEGHADRAMYAAKRTGKNSN